MPAIVERANKMGVNTMPENNRYTVETVGDYKATFYVNDPTCKRVAGPFNCYKDAEQECNRFKRNLQGTDANMDIPANWL
jgi:hypothetical protein